MLVRMQSVAPQIARRINDRAALDLLAAREEMTRSEMRTALGMSQPSILELFDRLLQDGLIEEAGQVEGRRGPRAQVYRINPRRAFVVVARVARQEIVASVSNLLGEFVSTSSSPAPTTGSESLHSDVATTVEAAIVQADIDRTQVRLAVVATPGVVDPETGDVGYVAHRPEWRGALRTNLERDLGIPVHLENQVKLLGLAELEARRAESFALVSIGPAGLATAVVLDGTLWRGAHGAAGEIAYMPTGSELPVLGPDNSATGNLGELISRLAVEQPLRLESMVHPIAYAIAAICTVVDPGEIILAGPTGQAGGDPLAEAIEHALAAVWPVPVPVTPTRVSGDAVLKGAARAGLDRLLPELWGPQTGLTNA